MSDNSGGESPPGKNKRKAGDGTTHGDATQERATGTIKRPALVVTLESLLAIDLKSSSGLRQFQQDIARAPETITNNGEAMIRLAKEIVDPEALSNFIKTISPALLENPKFALALLPMLPPFSQLGVIRRLGDSVVGDYDFLISVIDAYYERAPCANKLHVLFAKENINKAIFEDSDAMFKAISVNYRSYYFVADSVKSLTFMQRVMFIDPMGEDMAFILDYIRLYPEEVERLYISNKMRENAGFVINALRLNKDIALEIAHASALKKIASAAYQYDILNELCAAPDDCARILRQMSDEAVKDICDNFAYADFKYVLKTTGKLSVIAFKGGDDEWVLRKTATPDIAELLGTHLRDIFKKANVLPLPNVLIDFTIDKSSQKQVSFNVYYNRMRMVRCTYEKDTHSFYLNSFFFGVNDGARDGFKKALRSTLKRSLVGYTMDLIVGACKALNAYCDNTLHLTLGLLTLGLVDGWESSRDISFNSDALMKNNDARERYLQLLIGETRPFKFRGDDTIRASERVHKAGYYGLWGFRLDPNDQYGYSRVLDITDNTYHSLNASMSSDHSPQRAADY